MFNATATFDLLHYGHLKHFQAAAKLGHLVVTLTSGKYMTKPGHPIFTDAQRLEMIGALRCLSSVMVIDAPDSITAIEEVNPDIYVKGIEYKGRLTEQSYCESRGITVSYTHLTLPTIYSV